MRISLSKTFHPHTYEQMEVVNRLVVLFLCMYNHKHRRTWDEILPYIQHSYNYFKHSSTRKIPFDICYGFQPSTPIDLINSSTQLNDTNFEGREAENALEFKDQIYNI